MSVQNINQFVTVNAIDEAEVAQAITDVNYKFVGIEAQ